MAETSTPSGLAFAGNRCAVAVSAGVSGQTHRITVNVGGRTAYEASVVTPLTFDISDIVQAATSGYSGAYFYDGAFVGEVEDYGTMSDRLVRVTGTGVQHSFVAVPGRTLPEVLKSLPGKEDIFTARFLNSAGNRFLTVRTDARVMSIPETDLEPLLIITKGSETIKFTDVLSGKSLEAEIGSGDFSVYAVDISRLRRLFFTRFGVLASTFNVRFNNVAPGMTLAVERVAPAKERYRVRFLNRYGAVESLSLTGTFTVEPTQIYQDFKRYDAGLDRFVRSRGVVDYDMTIKANARSAGTISPAFLLEMLASDDVYLQTPDGSTRRVIPSVDGLTVDLRPTTPQTYTILFAVVEDIVDYPGNNSRIFTPHFSSQFN